MRIVAADLFRYRLPLVEPLRFAFGTLAHRAGVLLCLTAEDGTEGWGEAAPLPGYSPDTLDDVLAEAPPLLRRYREGDARLDGFVASFERTFRRPKGRGRQLYPPSLRHAEAAALTDLGARLQGTSLDRALAELIDPQRPATPTSQVAVQALLVGTDEEVSAQARAAREAGYRAAKLKVGQQVVAADAARVCAVADDLGPEVLLRLDANQAWTAEQAADFAQQVRGLPIAFVEEPLREPEPAALRALQHAGLPIALDESVDGRTPVHTLRRLRFVDAIVLKPSLGRGLAFLHTWHLAVGVPMAFVVSSAFESGVGTRHSIALAAALGGGPAGLDPYRRLADDVQTERLPLDGPLVDVAAALALREVDLSRLEPVER
ncbi:MAG: o-succinylbenzoate synthase [Rhodothermaceae bacterium]|nr:o-succinylbenzoate synthase [Rhodothermaceae bacterium]